MNYHVNNYFVISIMNDVQLNLNDNQVYLMGILLLQDQYVQSKHEYTFLSKKWKKIREKSKIIVDLLDVVLVHQDELFS